MNWDFEEMRGRMTRAQRRGTHGTAAKDIMLVLAVLCLVASGVYWWQVQNAMTSNRLIAATYTAILTIAPPVLLSFCIPWSPGGMLLQKVNARTWGMVAVIGAAVYLLYYSFQLQWAWWSAQPETASANMVYQQVFVGLIGYILIPALLWTPVSSEELSEKLKQAQLVKRYELQAQADIAILQTTLLRAQQRAAVGFANLTVAERQELAGVMRGIVGGIDQTIQEIAGNLNNAVSTVYGPKVGQVFGAPAFADEMGDLIDYLASSLEGATMGEIEPARLAPASDMSSLPAMGPTRRGPVPVAAPSADLPQQNAPDQAAQARSVQGGQEPISADLRSAQPIPDHQRYLLAFGQLGGQIWTDPQLAGVLKLADNTARKIRAAWVAAGVVESGGSQGRWTFTENEAA